MPELGEGVAVARVPPEAEAGMMVVVAPERTVEVWIVRGDAGEEEGGKTCAVAARAIAPIAIFCKSCIL